MRVVVIYDLLLLLLFLVSGHASEQKSFEVDHRRVRKRPLKGRFLHITDIHPDPHYKSGSTLASGCHERPKKKHKSKDKLGLDQEEEVDGGIGALKGDNLAGKWGTAVSNCDSPSSLVNITFNWLKEEWADEIDFVVWTGDNARHDIDRSLPRTPNEIFTLNRMIVEKMLDTFGRDMPIVPSIGNNDIYPHNILAAGPNRMTEEFLLIWKHFIPSEAAHVFERGAYFSVEVIPDRLAVISLNTIFWYDSNTIVDGCSSHSNDPGALEMDWLDIQLNNFRQRGMQVWLTGHVPPHMGRYYDDCYLRYGDLALRYQDTIVGHLFGHMNVDHFFFIDVDELEATSKVAVSDDSTTSNRFHQDLSLPQTHSSPSSSGPVRPLGRSGAKNLEKELKKDFGEMPGPRMLNLKDYAIVNVAASVIPTYHPGLRIYSYNISGVDSDAITEHLYIGRQVSEIEDEESDLEDEESDIEDEDDELLVHIEPLGGLEANKRKGGHKHGKQHKGSCSLPENEDKPHCLFRRKPRHYSKNSPSRRNRALSPLGYTQFYLPSINQQKEEPQWEVEYSTHKIRHLVPPSHNLSQPIPIPLHLLPEYDPQIFSIPKNKSDRKEILKKRENFYQALKNITPYKMKDLTIGSYIKLARMLVLEKKMWRKFAELMLVSTESNEQEGKS
ncbi:hypothetical protein L204_101349 [Cryptococcus depauperatus]